MQHLQPNTTLQGGKYRIERVLGQGGFGITYSAVQVTLNRRVAIKEFFMKEYCERNADTSHVTLGTASGAKLVNRFKEKFLKEAALIAQFDNPHIVRIHDIFEENNTAYYVMEFLEDRWSQLGKNGIPWELSLNIIKQVGDGLSYLHSQNVLHLDVKPSNILFRKDCAVLIDFGISKRYDNQGGQTSTTPVGISKGFAPLEQYNQGVQIFQPATDIYSLGATLYKILTGETPPEASQVMNYGLPTGILRTKHVPEKIISVIQKSMEPRVVQRYQSVSQLFDAIGEVPRRATWGQDSPQKPVDTFGFVISDKIEEEGTIVEPSPAPPPHPKPSESNTTGKFITSLMIVCAIVVAIIMFSPNGSSDGSTPSQPSQPQTQIVEKMYYETAIGKCQYSGPVDDDGIPNGKGEAFFYDGRYYKGFFVHGNLTGENAYFKYNGGDEFKGVFRDNHFYYGRYTISSDKSYFEGSYKKGKKFYEPDKGTWYDKNGKVLEQVK